MVRNQIELKNGYNIVFETDGNNWCTVSIVNGEKITKLGADIKSIIYKKIIEGFGKFNEREAVGTIEGIKVISILSLFEEHCSLYFGIRDDEKILFIQNAKGELIERLRLTNSDLEKMKESKWEIE